MAAPQKKERRGGARPNSGPKKQALSVRQVNAALKAAKEYAKKYGKTIDQILLDMIYDEDGGKRDKLAAIKLWKDFTAIKISEGGEADRSGGLKVYIPEMRKESAEVVALESKRDG